MYKRITAFALVLMLLFGVSSYSEEKYTMAGYDQKEVYRTWKDHAFFQEMERISAVGFSFQQFDNKEEWEKQKQRYMDGESMPDVLFKAQLTDAETIEMYEKGLLLDVSPLLKEHAPNLYRILEENPALRQSISMKDGAIAALPFVDVFPSYNIMWVNKNWLRNLKLDIPKDADALLDMLVQFKTLDPNNNAKADEVPLSLTGVYDLKYLAHAFGIVTDDFNLAYENGAVVHMTEKEGFLDFVRFLGKLNSHKLLSKDALITSENLRRQADHKAYQTQGLIISPIVSHYVPLEWVEDYVAVPPLNYKGEQAYREIARPYIKGTFAISKQAKSPEKLLAWVDYLYREAGSRLARLGKEGQDYYVDGDDTWRRDNIYSTPGAVNQLNMETGAVIPGISLGEFQVKYQLKGVAFIASEMEKYRPYVKSPMPDLMLDRESAKELLSLQAQLGKELDAYLGRWVLGQIEANEAEVKVLQDKLQAMGLARLKEIFTNLIKGGK